MSSVYPYRSIQPKPRNPPELLAEGHLLRTLGLVRMIRAAINLQLLQHLVAEFVLRQHAPDRSFDHRLRLFSTDEARGALLEAARIEGVMTVDLVLFLLAGQPDLLGVDDDHV